MAATTGTEMTRIVVDETKCIKCGACAVECPSFCIKWTKGAAPVTSTTMCSKCGHCAAVCPVGALSWENRSLEADFPPIRPELAVSEAQIEQLVRSRRSIRRFLPGPIPQAKIDRLLEITHYTQTSGNTQMIEYLVLVTPEQVRKYAVPVVEWIKAKNLPYSQYVTSQWDVGQDPIFRGAPVVIIALSPAVVQFGMPDIDGSIALTTLSMVAPSLGLGTCWAGFFQLAVKEYAPLQALIPEGKVCVGAIMVGEPVPVHRRLVPRNPVKVTYLS